jgi:hypothetical protein
MKTFTAKDYEYLTGSAAYRFDLPAFCDVRFDIRSSAGVSVSLVNSDGLIYPVDSGLRVEDHYRLSDFLHIEVAPTSPDDDVIVRLRVTDLVQKVDSTPAAVNHMVRPDPIRAQVRSLVSEFLAARGMSFDDLSADRSDGSEDDDFDEDFLEDLDFLSQHEVQDLLDDDPASPPGAGGTDPAPADPAPADPPPAQGDPA